MSVINIPNIATDRPINAQPQADLVEALEKLLAASKEGRVQAVAFAIVESDRTTATAWKGGFVAGELMTAVAWLFYRYGRAFDSGKDYNWEGFQPKEPA